jgi:protease-4
MMGSLLSAQGDKAGPYDEPRESQGFSESSPHLAVIELSGSVVELRSISLFSGFEGLELRAITEKLDALATNDSVTGLVLRVGELSLSMSIAEELREALIGFKKTGSGRAITCHTEATSNLTYYVLTACDSIALAPNGSVFISGVAAMPLHLKGLLDRFNIRADFIHVGAFKGAAEPLTLDAPSKQMLETLGAILDRSHETMVAGIAQGRKLDPAQVKGLIDTAVFQGDQAVAAKLVDEVSIFQATRDRVAGDNGWRVEKVVDRGPPDMAKIMELVGLTPRVRPSEPHVALVYAVGNVVDGKGDGILGARKEIASRPLSSALRVLAADDAVKAVVLRINSGGGSALSSELIWNAVKELSAAKPVVVSMSSVAASGGYYIAASATKIYALDNTLTGSIGVVGGKLSFDKALAKIGVKAYPIGRGKNAHLFNPLAPWNAEDRKVVMALMQSTYDVFVSRVSAGRNMDTEAVNKVAQGRVWTGADARAHGLVDEIGGLGAALAEARKLGQVDAEAALEVYPPDPTLMDFLGAFGVSAPLGLKSGTSQAILAEVGEVLGPEASAAINLILEQLTQLAKSPVQAALYFPVVFR